MRGCRKLYLRARIRTVLWWTTSDTTAQAPNSIRRRVFVALAADYGNLGDLAITYAQVRFLEGAYPEAVVETIPISRTLSAIKRLRQVMQPHDVIALIGGGNTGDMYDDIQYLRELFIRNFPRNPIISFPQTIDFSQTPYGRWAANRARKTYAKHRDLAIMARDRRSHRRALELFPACQILLAPDVVLTMDKSLPAGHREGVLVAFRSDRERSLTEAEIDAVSAVVGRVGSVRRRDTHIGDVRVSESETQSVLEDFWADCRASRLVVTDRLHAMIFAVITGTPCLAFDSGTGKVAQFYGDWLSDHPRVTLSKDARPTSVQNAIQGLLDSSDATGADLSAVFGEQFASWRASRPSHE